MFIIEITQVQIYGAMNGDLIEMIITQLISLLPPTTKKSSYIVLNKLIYEFSLIDNFWKIILGFGASNINNLPISCELQFENVSCLNVSSNSSISHLEDIVIIDKKEEGWSAPQRYQLTDVENEFLTFYFEKFKIINAQSE